MTIGVTTYVARYDESFKKLLRRLCGSFPDCEIVVAVNGHPDRNRQRDYLAQLRADWEGQCEALFLVRKEVHGLTRLWCEILEHSTANPVLVLNDDLTVSPSFSRWLACLPNLHARQFVKLNGSWSHFLFDRSLLDSVGWFDPGFKGIGFEDFDYELRMRRHAIEVESVYCPYLDHRAEVPEDTSFDDLTGRARGKYSRVNWEYFNTKWSANRVPNGGEYFPPYGKYVLPLQGDYTIKRPDFLDRRGRVLSRNFIRVDL